MASSSTLESLLAVVLALILAALSSTTNTNAVWAARPLDNQKQPMVRLAPLRGANADDNENDNNFHNSTTSSTTCWESLFELQACTGEVMLFFLSGETYLGRECCHAIHIIELRCWPSMIVSLGYTAEETDILRGYCDDTGSVAPPPPEMEIHSTSLPDPPLTSTRTFAGISP